MKRLSVPERLTKNRFNLDEQESHIEVNQEIAKATGTGKAIVACCPAHVYAEELLKVTTSLMPIDGNSAQKGKAAAAK